MRLIDADALASALNNGRLEEQTGRAVPFNAGVAFALTMVEYAPTIEPEPHWISCEERLPEKEKPYHRRDFFLTTNAYGAVNVTTYEFENDFQKRGWQSDIRIIAWMPLPEPYDGERRDDE